MGNIILEPGARPNTSELNAVNWLHSTLGGDITVLKRVDIDNVKTPDLLWRGTYLEIKHVGGNIKTLDQQIRKGFHQTNRGTVLVDISTAAFIDDEAINTAIKRSWQTGGGCVIIIRDDKFIAYICR